MKPGIKTIGLTLAVGLLMVVRANAQILAGTYGTYATGWPESRTGSPTDTNGWPEGAAAVSSLKSCVGWWQGTPFNGGEWDMPSHGDNEKFIQALTNGQWHLQFRGDTEKFMQAVTNFAAIRAPTLDLVIHDGPMHDQFLELNKRKQPDTDSRVDWEFVVWNPESWNQLYNPTNAAMQHLNAEAHRLFPEDPSFYKPVPAPRLDVYIGGGGVDWAKVTIPAGLHVRDQRKPK